MQICKRFSVWCLDQGIPENIGNEIEWLESLVDQGMAAATIKTYAFAVKAYLIDNLDCSDMTEDEKILTHYRMESEFRSFRLPRDAKKKNRDIEITFEDIVQILQASKPRSRVIIEFLANTGVRVSELTGVRLSHVRKRRESEFHVRIMGKGRKQRVVRIKGGLRKRIAKEFPDTLSFLFESSPGQPYSSQGIHDLVKRAGERVGIYGLHPHSFRHYFATTLLKKTWKLKAISEYLGHSDEATTLIYIGKDCLTMDDLDQGFYGNRGKNGRKGNAVQS
ncbi:MAG: tyrosine-type recombinase/integrase [Spirochaetales bacterium]|nr:tyrosine-type recombinase/integrase [Spirochaetales bacterium]